MSSEIPEPLSFKEPIRIALVLGCGGARGLAHVGVLEELENANIPIDLIVGCSAGSLVGALYASNPCATDIKDKLYCLKRQDLLIIEPLTSCYGLGHGNELKQFLLGYLEDIKYEDLHIPLISVATDLYNGELVCFASGPVAPTVHASCAYPFLFSPVFLYSRVFVDGGVVDPIPVEVARRHNPDLVIAVDLSTPLSLDFPTNLFGVAKRSAEIQFLRQSEKCVKDADIVIKPQLGDIGTFDDGFNDAIYWAGREAAQEAIPAILAAISARQKTEDSVVESTETMDVMDDMDVVDVMNIRDFIPCRWFFEDTHE